MLPLAHSLVQDHDNPFTWGAELQGEATDLQYLSGRLKGPAISVSQLGTGYLLRSEQFDGICDISKAQLEIDRVVAVLNGLMKLLRFAKEPITKVDLFGLDNEGALCSVVIAVPVSLSITTDDGTTITVQS